MSEQFKVGDDVIVVNDFGTWLDQHDLPRSTVLHVVEKHGLEEYFVDAKNELIEIEALRDYPEDFQLVNSTARYATGGLIGQHNIGLIGEQLCEHTVYDKYKETLVEVQNAAEPKLGVYRPVLETRKVGKVRVELVDDGFPLALREVAKVMTWAQTAKGYKDHDWQNLPNWEQQLAAATSRHRTDFIIQRYVEELGYDDCNDPESQLIHKAHEAFGVLAQLELMLRNKSK